MKPRFFSGQFVLFVVKKADAFQGQPEITGLAKRVLPYEIIVMSDDASPHSRIDCA